MFFHDFSSKIDDFVSQFHDFFLVGFNMEFQHLFYAILLLKWSRNYIKKTLKIHHFRLLIRRIPFWSPPRSFWSPFGCHLRSFGLHFNPLGRTLGSILAALARVGWPFARVEPNQSRFRMLLIACWLHFRSFVSSLTDLQALQLFWPASR